MIVPCQSLPSTNKNKMIVCKQTMHRVLFKYHRDAETRDVFKQMVVDRLTDIKPTLFPSVQ